MRQINVYFQQNDRSSFIADITRKQIYQPINMQIIHNQNQIFINENNQNKEFEYIKRYAGYFRKVYRSLQVRVPRNILKYLSIQKLPQSH